MIVLKCVTMQAIENCVSAAGYDVGEYAALVFAGAMSFEDGMYHPVCRLNEHDADTVNMSVF